MTDEFSSENRVGFADGSFARACKTCNVIKDISDYPVRGINKDGSIGYFPHCERCYRNITREKANQYRANNLEEVRAYDRKRMRKTKRLSNRSEKQHEYIGFSDGSFAKACKTCHIIKDVSDYPIRDNTGDTIKYYPHCNRCFTNIKETYNDSYFQALYNDINKIDVKEKRREINRNRYQKEAPYKLRGNVSNAIRLALKKNGSSKFGKSFINYIGYTMEDLKEHIESQFDNWMNWSNWGLYNKQTWNDDDQSTWTWQLDHIIPHSDFYYTSMEDQAFKDCWTLSNLRPLSAKQNLLDGIKRVRHKKDRA